MCYYTLLCKALIEIGFPTDAGDLRQNFLQLNLLIFFVLDYFHFYPTLICIMIIQLAQIPTTSFLYGEEITAALIINVVIGCIWQAFNLFFTHLLMN